jgi:hypothetical protein
MDDIKRHPSVAPDDFKHPKPPESHVHPHLPGAHVWCRHVGTGHTANVYFRDAHPHFDIDGCNGCREFMDCGQAEGKLPAS